MADYLNLWAINKRLEEIEKLKELKAQGMITSEEGVALRDKIVNNIRHLIGLEPLPPE